MKSTPTDGGMRVAISGVMSGPATQAHTGRFVRERAWEKVRPKGWKFPRLPCPQGAQPRSPPLLPLQNTNILQKTYLCKPISRGRDKSGPYEGNGTAQGNSLAVS